MDGINHMAPILSYPIASGEMYYAVANERTVWLQGNPEAGFSLYGAIPGGSEASSVNLAEMLLEFAMAWNTAGDASQARRRMQVFGSHLGQALAEKRAQAKPVDGVLERAANAVEDILRSLDASFACWQTESEVRYQIDPSPLQVVAGATGMECATELAHHALNAMCESVVGVLAPELHVQLPDGPNAEQVILLRNGWQPKLSTQPGNEHLVAELVAGGCARPELAGSAVETAHGGVG